MPDIYVRLREKLDGLAKGYPETDTGYELEYIKGYFTPEEAEMFIVMPDEYVTAEEVAALSGQDIAAVGEKLAAMAAKGLLFRLRKGEDIQYHIIPVVHGLMEFRIHDFDADKMKKFVSLLSAKGLTKSLGDTKVPFYRTVPVRAELISDNTILPYDDAVSIVKKQKTVAIADCVCRKSMELIGKPCKAAGNRMETCLCFGDWADYYVENGLGRYVTQRDALELLERNEKEGLVTQIANSMDAEIICSCCACCCGFLAAFKYFEAPCREFNSNYTCTYDQEACVNCGKCAERCPVGAARFKDEQLLWKKEKCLGCGLCVATCPAKARALVQKPAEKTYRPPETMFDAYKLMAAYRRQP